MAGMSEIEEAQWLLKKYFENLDLAARLKEMALQGFDTWDDYVKYGDAFCTIKFPLIRKNLPYHVGFFVGGVDRWLSKKIRKLPLGEDFVRGWRRGYFRAER
jgi:hypothetical protein